MKNLLAAAALTLLLAPGARAQAPAAPYRLLHTIPVPGDGGWDFMTIDPTGERLYVAHNAQVDVIDLATRRVVGTVTGTPAAHGVAVVPATGRGYVSCGRNNYCVTFDLKTFRNLG